MNEVIQGIFGVYEPITYQIVQGDEVQTVVAQGLAGVNFEYVAGVLLFAIVLYSVLRIIGLLFR